MASASPGSELGSWLEKEGLDKSVTHGLSPFGVSSPRDLALLTPSDLKDVIESLDLPRVQQIKLSLAVRRFDADQGTRVVLTPKEDDAFKILLSLSQNAQGFLKEIHGAMSSTEEHASKAQQEVIKLFDKLFDALKKRKQQLLTEIKKHKKEKLDAFQLQSQYVSDVISKYSQARSDCEQLLKITSLDALPDREGRIRKNIENASNLKIDTKLSKEPEMFYRYYEQDVQLMKSFEELGKIALGAKRQPHPTIKSTSSTTNSIQVDWIPVLEKKDTPPVEQYEIEISETEEKCAEGGRANIKTLTFDRSKSSCTFANLKKDTQYSVRTRTKNENGWSDFGEPSNVKTSSHPEWMETGDQAQGFKPLWGSPTVRLAVSKSNKFPSPSEELECPGGYHWATLQECKNAKYPNTSEHPYHCLAGWNAYTFNGVYRFVFLFKDSRQLDKYVHAGQGYYNPNICHGSPLSEYINGNLFAGLVCIKD